MTSVIKIGAEEIVNSLPDLSLQDQKEMKNQGAVGEEGCEEHDGICAICLDNILPQETALVKGCEHAYCVTCILRWAEYSRAPSCPQCKHPFELLKVHRSLDGRFYDYMFEESVCLLLRATWFKPVYDDMEYYYDYYQYEDEDDQDEVSYNSSPRSRLGTIRWGYGGFGTLERQEARPVRRSNLQDSGAGSSREPKEAAKSIMRRRANRALKREAADKAAAAKHQRHLVRLGRNIVQKRLGTS